MAYNPAVLNTIAVVKFSLARKGVESARGTTHLAQTACAYLTTEELLLLLRCRLGSPAVR